jgi:hypothetical protein
MEEKGRKLIEMLLEYGRRAEEAEKKEKLSKGIRP